MGLRCGEIRAGGCRGIIPAGSTCANDVAEVSRGIEPSLILSLRVRAEAIGSIAGDHRPHAFWRVGRSGADGVRDAKNRGMTVEE